MEHDLRKRCCDRCGHPGHYGFRRMGADHPAFRRSIDTTDRTLRRIAIQAAIRHEAEAAYSHARFQLGPLASEVANFITFQSPMVVIARHLGLADAGAYSASNRFASIPNQVVLSAVMGVLFPAFSRMMDDKQRRRDALMFSTQVLTVLLAPMMFGLWAIAEPAMLVIFGQNWAYAWPVLGLLALSKGILTPCSTFIPYLKGAGYGRVLFWSATIRAVVTTAAVWLAAIYGTLIDAMIWLCIVNAVTLVAYSWAVFKASETPLIKGLYVSSRPMIAAFLMALAVRYILHMFGDSIPHAYMQVAVGAVAGGLIYGVLILLTERALLRKIIGLVKNRKAQHVVVSEEA